MLTLNRKENQSVYIGDDIKVVVKRVIRRDDGTHDVRLGFDAPKHITIDREEVRERRLEKLERVFNGSSK